MTPLAKYGHHLPSCGLGPGAGNRGACTCGLTAALVAEAAHVVALRKRRVLAEGAVEVTGSPIEGSPGSRDPYTGGYPPEPPCIDDLGITFTVCGKEFNLGMYADVDKLCIEIESAVLDDLATGDDDEPLDTRND